jgi:hypothetical protein
MGAAISSGLGIGEVPTERSREPIENQDFSSATADSQVSQNDRTPSASVIFWSTTFVLIGLGFLIGPFLRMQNGEPDQVSSGLFNAGFAMLLGLPALQLLAIAITLFILLGHPERTNLRVELRRLGKIAIGSTVGVLAGLAIMFLFVLPLIVR